MPSKTQIWLRSLIAAVVTGASSSGLAGVGIAGANALGVNVSKLDLKQLGAMCVAGGLVGMLSYLKQSPVPPVSTGETEIVPKPPTQNPS